MVKILKVSAMRPEHSKISEAAEALREAKLVVYPTETVYGLAGDAKSDLAVAAVFEAKGKSFRDPVSVAVDSLEMAREVGRMTGVAENLFERFLPGPLTLVVKARPSISTVLTAGTGTIGVRMPDNRVAISLVNAFRGPITSTSANISGEPAPKNAQEAARQLGDSVSLVLDGGKCHHQVPSTVIDATKRKPVMIREGPITLSDVEEFLKI